MPNLCDGFTCPYFGVCRSDSGKRSCNCIETCTAAKFDPVCSTQGITYPNLCSLKKEACDKQTDQIKLQNKGFCDQGFALSKYTFDFQKLFFSAKERVQQAENYDSNFSVCSFHRFSKIILKSYVFMNFSKHLGSFLISCQHFTN